MSLSVRGSCYGGSDSALDEQAGDTIRINRQIEAEINDEKKKMKNRIKILLLGCGEAGKVIFKFLCFYMSVFRIFIWLNVFQPFSEL